jgi:hypothetical protein
MCDVSVQPWRNVNVRDKTHEIVRQLVQTRAEHGALAYVR